MDYEIIYLEADDIRENIEVIKKERSDENGLPDMDGLVKHLFHRQMLEIRICKELFPDNSHIWKSKKYVSYCSTSNMRMNVSCS